MWWAEPFSLSLSHSFPFSFFFPSFLPGPPSLFLLLFLLLLMTDKTLLRADGHFRKGCDTDSFVGKALFTQTGKNQSMQPSNFSQNEVWTCKTIPQTTSLVWLPFDGRIILNEYLPLHFVSLNGTLAATSFILSINIRSISYLSFYFCWRKPSCSRTLVIGRSLFRL